MDAKRYRQIRQLFDAVMEQPLEQRHTYLEEAGRGDTALRDQVRQLLAASGGQTALFDRPAVVRDGSGPLERWEGRHLGPYQILRELGEGGMGIVYLARRADGAFQKEVAIKIVRQDLATPQFLQRFQRERDILAKLEHPHIARLLDGGTSPAFLAMEYVKGEPLLAFADSRKLIYDARLELLRQIASAVDYAHRQGVIHRDLKPANIFVTSEGEVKLLDFGIAAWQQGDRESELSPTLAMSPAYASPEQIRGDKTNHATDIYSLGLIAYELLAGVQPFHLKQAALAEVLRTVLEDTPATPSIAVRDSADPRPSELSRRRQMAPVELINRLQQADGALLQAISKRREERPASALALMEGLTSPNPEPGKAIAPWVLTLRRNLDLIVFELAFLWLVSYGHVQLNAASWFVYAILTFFVISQRFGLVSRWYQQSPGYAGVGVLVVIAVGGIIAISPSSSPKAHAAKAVNLVLLIGIPSFGFYVQRYARRSKELGTLLFTSGKVRAQPVLVGISLLLQLLSVGLSFYEDTSHGLGISRLLFVFLQTGGLWMIWRPFEIWEKGVVVFGNPVPWSAIRKFRWLSSSELQLILQGDDNNEYRTRELRAQIDPAEKEKVQTIVEDWLLEIPQEMTFSTTPVQAA